MVGKKRVKKFNFSNKLAYTLIVIALVIGLGVGVIANTVGTAPNPGHLLSTVSPDSPCSSGQVIGWNGVNLVCTTPTATDSRFTISSSGLCYTAPATCALSTQSCNHYNYYTVDAGTDCSSLSQSTMNTMCVANCPFVACDGDTTTSCTGGTARSNTVYASCGTGNGYVDCECSSIGTYLQEIYTPAGQRCI